MSHAVISADFHRNGVGGEGFCVALVDTTIEDQTRRFLVTWFPEYLDDDSGDLVPYQARVAVVCIDMAFMGNVLMHPAGDIPGGNAWHGADRWSSVLPDILTHAFA
jgi:hypothetical protein